MPIRILDASVVGRIAAGEVVERPSSVVKELVENSIDAGATAITVEIRGGGIDYLRVTDNGCGIAPSQVRMAFENHATSKLQSADQLDDIRTLGFRGEALPSIASVSHVELTTRERGQEIGVKLLVDGGEDMRVQETGCPEGTTFIMRDLFYNVPVRRAFLKKPNYEGGLVSDAVARMIIGNPNIAIRYINNGNSLYHSFGDGKLRHAVFAVYGKQTAEQMVEVDASEGGMRLYGLIGIGELAKSTRSHQAFYINGRFVRCPLLSKALEEVCKSRVTIGMYPMCALNLVVPPSSVNVNVHPNKLEVRFKDELLTRSTAEKLLESAFEGEHVLQIGPEKPEAHQIETRSTVRELPIPGPKANSPLSAPEPQTPSEISRVEPIAAPASATAKAPKPEKGEQLDLFHRAVDEALRQFNGPLDGALHEGLSIHPTPLSKEGGKLKATEPVRVDAASQNAEPPAAEDASETEMTPALKADYRVIGVVLNTYILIEADDSLVLIDQHAAHERLQYEKLMAQLAQGTGSQQLLTPLVLHVSSREMALIEENMDALRESGYEVERFGEQDVQVRAVPFILGRAELRPAFMDTIGALSRLRGATEESRRAEIMQMACKSAVKGGDRLSPSEIDALIQNMLATGAPPTCPHGRPVMKSLPRRELEKMFKRIQ